MTTRSKHLLVLSSYRAKTASPLSGASNMLNEPLVLAFALRVIQRWAIPDETGDACCADCGVQIAWTASGDHFWPPHSVDCAVTMATELLRPLLPLTIELKQREMREFPISGKLLTISNGSAEIVLDNGTRFADGIDTPEFILNT